MEQIGIVSQIPVAEPAPGIEVRWLDLHSSDPGLVRSIARLTSEMERNAADCFSAPGQRAEYLARRGLRRAVLAAHLDIPAVALEFVSGPGGRPRLARRHGHRDLSFSCAASSACAIVAVARGRRVGVDIEHIRRGVPFGAIARHCFTARERSALAASDDRFLAKAFYRIWTRKEALLKGAGRGLRHDPRTIEVNLPDGVQVDTAELGSWELHDLALMPGFAVALALADRGPGTLAGSLCRDNVLAGNRG